MALQSNRGDGVAFAVEIEHDYDAQILSPDIGHLQSDVFGNRIVLAIAGACVESDERRTPDVVLAVLGEVLHRTDCKINGVVDLADPGAAVALPYGRTWNAHHALQHFDDNLALRRHFERQPGRAISPGGGGHFANRRGLWAADLPHRHPVRNNH